MTTLLMIRISIKMNKMNSEDKESKIILIFVQISEMNYLNLITIKKDVKYYFKGNYQLHHEIQEVS